MHWLQCIWGSNVSPVQISPISLIKRSSDLILNLALKALFPRITTIVWIGV
jgi:hypothetical protein